MLFHYVGNILSGSAVVKALRINRERVMDVLDHSTITSATNPKNAFMNVGLSLENRQEARKLGLLPPGKSFEAACERLEPQERKEPVIQGTTPTLPISIALFGLNTRIGRHPGRKMVYNYKGEKK